MADKAASVLARLQNKAIETGRSFQLCLQLFCQEEFLRRVEISKYADNLVLKGGLFVYTLTKFESRVTVDVDFLLKNIPNTQEEIIEMVKNIILIDTGNDFVKFEIKKADAIAVAKKYPGICVSLTATIKNTRTPVNIDFGIGDIIVPKQEKRSIPTQLDDFRSPIVSTYSLESTIAEKLDAIIFMMEFSSRMKDYYDIYYLANKFEFDGKKLQEAIRKTFENRDRNYEIDSFKNIISFSEDDAMVKKWQSFLKKLKVPAIPFTDVLKTMDLFLGAIYQLIIEKKSFAGTWAIEKNEWIKK